MKVFISWSGTTSQQIAQELRGWLPLILQTVEPFLTVSDIEKGARWQGEITNNLGQSNFGILCLTRDNLDSQWIAFEAGALSKQLTSRVATVLFGIGHRDVQPPLAMFQGTLFEKTEVRKLIGSINSALATDQQREEAQLDTLFDMLWPKLEGAIDLILKNPQSSTPVRQVGKPDYAALVEELLALSRANATSLSNLERRTPEPRNREPQTLREADDDAIETTYEVRRALSLARTLRRMGRTDDRIVASILQRLRRGDVPINRVELENDRVVIALEDGRNFTASLPPRRETAKADPGQTKAPEG